MRYLSLRIPPDLLFHLGDLLVLENDLIVVGIVGPQFGGFLFSFPHRSSKKRGLVGGKPNQLS